MMESRNFERFCVATSLHGWRFLSNQQGTSKPLRIGWIAVVLASIGVAIFFLTHSILDFSSSTVQTTQDTSRASLKNVFFPSVTLCNINQGRSSLFHHLGLSNNDSLLRAVHTQAYYGSSDDLSFEEMSAVESIFASEEVIKKGFLADFMFQETAYRQKALQLMEDAMATSSHKWKLFANESYIKEAGWYFKTLAVQEVGENVVLRASYRRVEKDISTFTSLLPFFGTDYGLCTLIKPQITFDPNLEHIPFETLMVNHTQTIKPGIQLGKENGLSILLDAEVYDYGFSPHRGEGFKVAIHHHMDQPIMALSDVDISPGFVTQLSVTPALTVTTLEAKSRFTPDQRACYFDDELKFKYLPSSLYRYGLSNCLFAATYQEIIRECRCVPFFHTMAYKDVPMICSGKGLLCMNTILSDIGSHTHVVDHNGDRRLCYSPCTDQSNTVAVTTSVFPNVNTFTQGPEFCVLFHKLLSTCNTYKNLTFSRRYPGLCNLLQKHSVDTCLRGNASKFKSGNHGESVAEEDPFTKAQKEERLQHQGDLHRQVGDYNIELTMGLYRYARENLALVNVYIKDPAVTQVKRDQKVPLIWFVANIGGILGLTMGCSLVTIFEILHHVIICFIKTSVKSLTSMKRTLHKSKNQQEVDDEKVSIGSKHLKTVELTEDQCNEINQIFIRTNCQIEGCDVTGVAQTLNNTER